MYNQAIKSDTLYSGVNFTYGVIMKRYIFIILVLAADCGHLQNELPSGGPARTADVQIILV